MAYNTPYTPYTNYSEINQCLRDSGWDLIIEVEEYKQGLVYALFFEGDRLDRYLTINSLLSGIQTQLGAIYMRRHFLKSKLDKHGVESL